MSKLSTVGFGLVACTAAGNLAAVLLRSYAQREWREWWVGAWAPRAEFTPGGWYCAVGARGLTGLGLALSLLGTLESSGRQ